MQIKLWVASALFVALAAGIGVASVGAVRAIAHGAEDATGAAERPHARVWEDESPTHANVALEGIFASPR